MAIKKAVLMRSTQEFYLPPTIISDFENYLNTDIPNANYTFELIHDWFNRPEKPLTIRATYFPVNWKSKVGNSDMASNFKTDHNNKIYKGDYVVSETDGRVYILSWWVAQHINNQATQATACNTYLTFTRNIQEVIDGDGFLVTPAQEVTIVDNIPGVVTEYAARPDYDVKNHYPGVHADALASCSFQCNSTTKQIRLDDEFTWGLFKYRVVDVVYSEVDIGGENGVIQVYGKRVAGENNADD